MTDRQSVKLEFSHKFVTGKVCHGPVGQVQVAAALLTRMLADVNLPHRIGGSKTAGSRRVSIASGTSTL